MDTRRDFLKFLAMFSGAAGATALVPDSIQRAYAIEPEPGSTYLDAAYIVILMQENRSFDHALGTLKGVRGFNDPRAIRLANGNSIFVQADAGGNSYAPWRLDIKDTRVTWMGSIPHSRNSQVDAWNEGHHDGWIEAKRSHIAEYAHLPLTMGHYTREDLPFYYALADAFTVCDQNYCSVMTSTTPNRSCFWTGTVRDEQHPDSKVYMRNDQYARGGMSWKTFPERLHDAGISWKFYQNELTYSTGLSSEEHAWLSNFGCNLLEDFAAFTVEAYSGSTGAIQSRLTIIKRQTSELERSLGSEQDSQTAAQTRIRLEYNNSQIARLEAALTNSAKARYSQLTERQRALHDAAFVTNAEDPHYHELEELRFRDGGKQQMMMVPKGDIFYQFRKDVDEGKLSAISWLSAPEKFSDHPTSPWYGAWYVSEVVDILTKNPELWKKTILIITYDENDGYFDHAPSFVAADPKRPETGRASAGIDTGLEYTYAADELAQGVSQQEARSGPIGMGFRVPMIVASPWSRGGWVNSQLFDHTSTLMFLEHFVQQKYGKTTKEENISAWRRCVAGDLTSIFRPFDLKERQLQFLDRDKFVTGIQRARYKEVPSNYRKLSTQQIEEINNNPLHSNFISHQEPGVRTSCALPYELYADACLSSDRKKIELRMKAGNAVHGVRTAGAAFNVYLRNTKKSSNEPRSGMRVATYAVSPGDTIIEQFPLTLFEDGKYVLDVHAPNGFFRSFSGDSQAVFLLIQAAYEQNGPSLTGNIQLNLKNTTERALGFTVTDNSYRTATVTGKIAPGEQIPLALDLRASHNWYDFTVQTKDNIAFARFAGHVETGRPSFSDPFMGAIVGA